MIGLAAADVERGDLQAFESAARQSGVPLSGRLDLKAFPWPVIADDPWVPLDRAVFFGGRDWRVVMPVPTLDQRSREALAVVATHVEENTVSDSGHSGLAKLTGWLASVLAGHTTRTAPCSGREAVDLLKELGHPAADRIDALTTELASSRLDLGTARHKVRQLQDDVVAILINQLQAGLLGPRAAEQVVRLARAYDQD